MMREVKPPEPRSPLTRSRGMGASVLLAAAVLLSYAAIGVAAITSLNVSTILDFPGRVLSVGTASSPGSQAGNGSGSPTSPATSGLVGSSGGSGSGSSSLSPFGGSGSSAGAEQYSGLGGTTQPSSAPGATGGSSNSTSNGTPPPPKPPSNWTWPSN